METGTGSTGSMCSAPSPVGGSMAKVSISGRVPERAQQLDPLALRRQARRLDEHE